MAERTTGTHVLVVEDDGVDREAIERLLHRSASTRYETTTAPSLDRARAALARRRFDAVVLDLGLPDAAGLEGVAALREEYPSLPIVVLSGTGDRETALRAVQAGAQDFLLKGRADERHLCRAIDYAIERKRHESEIERLAYHDTVTGVANRTLLEDRLDRAVRSAVRGRHRFAAIYVDVDDFKEINDTLGHAAGDAVLKCFAERLAGAVRTTDTVARVGGDEFVVLAEGVQRDNDLARVATNVRRALELPIRIEGRSVPVSASVGVAVWPDDADEPEALLHAADEAMYRAKKAGSATPEFASPRLHALARGRERDAETQRRAVERHDIRVRYQPIYEIGEDDRTRFATVEALARWRRSDGRLLEAAEFVPGAEDSGAIVEIGRRVLEQTCGQLARWAGRPDAPPLHGSLNVSSVELCRPDLVRTVAFALDRARVPASRLAVEVREAALLVNERRAVSTLAELRSLGVHVTLDDYGQGELSHAHLDRLPVDGIKIDRRLVARVGDDDDAARIVEGIVLIAQGIGHEVVAAGVEDERQLRRLRDAGCERVQGFLMARPLPAAGIDRLLRASGRASHADPSRVHAS